jgi:hypothetical protein
MFCQLQGRPNYKASKTQEQNYGEKYQPRKDRPIFFDLEKFSPVTLFPST